MSIVFFGANNDFDPGGFPVALKVFPQLSFTWSIPKEATVTSHTNKAGIIANHNIYEIEKFAGSIIMVTNNSMINGPNENIASLFTDSNTAMNDRARREFYGLLPFLGGAFEWAIGSKPYGWNSLFDYAFTNLRKEKEIIGVYGPNDSRFKKMNRKRTYKYPGKIFWQKNAWMNEYNLFTINKVRRQGDYDNIHIHAKMMNTFKLDNFEKIQVHAPFCGHSCIHFHWRWSSTSVTGAKGNGEKYKGWKHPDDDTPEAHSKSNAPLIPPKQKMILAICNYSSTKKKFNDNNLLNPNSLKILDKLHKTLWYNIDIINPEKNVKQVIMEHGIGWAYRYATSNDDCEELKGLRATFMEFNNAITQKELADFFEKKVYPNFRYILQHVKFNGLLQQCPEGDFKEQEGVDNISMEKL